jgi:hypothetical protein
MSLGGLPVERLREYLGELSPAARALLIGEIERALLRGDEVAGSELVLQELRRAMRDGAAPSRIGNPARLFFRPLEPFLVDDALDHPHPGRIARAALDPIWSWLSRDLMPAEAAGYSKNVSQALLANETSQVAKLVSEFQDAVALRLEAALAAADDDKARRRLAAQVATPRALDDIRRLCGILSAREALTALASRLPGHIRNLADTLLDIVKAQLDAPHMRAPGMLLNGLIVVKGRLGAPWQLIRLATRAAKSDVAVRVAETPYAVAVDIVLGEIELQVRELRAELRSGQGVAVVGLLKSIHDAMRGVRTEIDLSGNSPWSRQVVAIRTDVSELLKSHIEAVPGRVRRLIRPRAAKEIAPGTTLDAGDVAETEALIEFVGACRHFASELAINEMTLRTYSEIQQYLDSARQGLLDALRHAGESERKFRRSQVDAAVRFCAPVFGQEHANVLAKAAGLAANSKAAKA